MTLPLTVQPSPPVRRRRFSALFFVAMAAVFLESLVLTLWRWG